MSRLLTLQKALAAIIPAAKLVETNLPLRLSGPIHASGPAQSLRPAQSSELAHPSKSALPPLKLYLLDGDYPQGELAPEEVQRVMNNPLYWVFCWASGQVVAQQILANPQWVRGKRILDFGSGCGVVGIAAALAGAHEVIACDIDPLALQATALNARLNGAPITLTADYYSIEGDVDLIVVADVLYDSSNFPWLERFAERAERVLIADSRVKNFDLPPYQQIGREYSCTLPDLDESEQFRDVRLYEAVRALR
ncbi:MAG: methyltransferase [Halioglobus sp.]